MVDTDASGSALDGIHVLELGSFIAGPFAGQLLGDLGADVIKVEPPSGDPMRSWGECVDGRSLWWPAIARNKRSVVIDLRTDAGRELAAELAANVDVVIENFRPGLLAEWGLDYGTLVAGNPGVILAHVSGYGQTGPRRSEPGFGALGEAVGGVRYTTGDPTTPPARCGISLGDSLAAMFTVVGVLSALVERHRSGRGQEIDTAIYEAVMALMESTVADWEIAGVQRERAGGVLKGVAPSGAYPTADGREVMIAANADAIFARLTQAMGEPQLADDDRYRTHADRAEHQAVLDAHLATWTATVPADMLVQLLQEHRVPTGFVNRASELATDPHIAARGMVQRLAAGFERDVPMTGVVPKLSRTPGSIRSVGPDLGEHTDAVLAELAGCDAAQLKQLHDAGVIA